MKRLFAESSLASSEIEIRKEQCVERDLAERQIRDGRIPGSLRAFVDARVERAQRRLKLIPDQLFECVEHRWSLPRPRC